MKETILGITGILTLIIVLVIPLNLGIKYKNEKISCQSQNKIFIQEYTLQCIKSLKVEENAYIANTCFEQASRLSGCK